MRRAYYTLFVRQHFTILNHLWAVRFRVSHNLNKSKLFHFHRFTKMCPSYHPLCILLSVDIYALACTMLMLSSTSNFYNTRATWYIVFIHILCQWKRKLFFSYVMNKMFSYQASQAKRKACNLFIFTILCSYR